MGKRNSAEEFAVAPENMEHISVRSGALAGFECLNGFQLVAFTGPMDGDRAFLEGQLTVIAQDPDPVVPVDREALADEMQQREIDLSGPDLPPDLFDLL